MLRKIHSGHALNLVCQKPNSVHRNTIKYTIRIMLKKSGNSKVMFHSSQTFPRFFPAHDPVFRIAGSNVNIWGEKKGAVSEKLVKQDYFILKINSY